MVDRTEPYKLYAIFNSSQPGRLHVSNDGGSNWIDCGISCWDIAQGHQDPDLLYIVERNSNKLLKSSDGGFNWVETNVNADTANPPSGYWQRRAILAVSPLNDQHIYVSYYWNAFSAEPNWNWLDYGIIVKSEDGGQTYEVIYEGGGKLFLSIAAGDQDIIFATGAGTDTSTDKCIKSLDGGDTWELVNTEYQVNTYGPVAIDPTYPDTVYLTAYTDFFGPFTGNEWASYVLKSTDCGETWTEIKSGLPTKGLFYQLFVDPVNHGTLYTIDIISGIYKTADGGTYWTSSNEGIHPSIDILDCFPWGSEVFCAAGNAILDQIIIGGAFRSYSNGDAWSSVMNLGLSTITLTDIKVSPENPDRIFAASYQNGPFEGGVWLSDNGGSSWRLAEPPQGHPWTIGYGNRIGASKISVAPGNPDVVYAMVVARDMQNNGVLTRLIYLSQLKCGGDLGIPGFAARWLLGEFRHPHGRCR